MHKSGHKTSIIIIVIITDFGVCVCEAQYYMSIFILFIQQVSGRSSQRDDKDSGYMGSEGSRKRVKESTGAGASRERLVFASW